MKIKEIESRRKRFGGADGGAINRHHIRVYLYAGNEFTLDCIKDGKPPFYNLYYFKNTGAAATVFVNGEGFWGDGLNWKDAEILADEAIIKLVEESYKTFPQGAF